MTKKKLDKILNVLAVLVMIWIAWSVLQIGMRSPLAESHEYSAWNLVVIVCRWFGM